MLHVQKNNLHDCCCITQPKRVNSYDHAHNPQASVHMCNCMHSHRAADSKSVSNQTPTWQDIYGKHASPLAPPRQHPHTQEVIRTKSLSPHLTQSHLHNTGRPSAWRIVTNSCPAVMARQHSTAGVPNNTTTAAVPVCHDPYCCSTPQPTLCQAREQRKGLQ